VSRRSRRLLRLVVMLLGVLGAARPGLPDDAVAPGPLTNEDIVRLVMTHTSERAIRERIERSPVDFDLEPEIVVELRRAGVPDRIIDLMRRRQAAMPRRAPEPTPTPPAAELGTLEVSFEAPADGREKGERPALAVRSLPATMTRTPGMEVGLVSDLAVAILCTTTDHVPDHWDTRSVLEGAPRHEMLLFHPGSHEEKMKGLEILSLEPEPSYSVRLPAGRHAIKVILAGLGTGSSSWRLLAADGASVRILAGETTHLVVRAAARLAGSQMTGFRIDAEWKLEPAPEPGEAEAALPPGAPTASPPGPSPGQSP